MPLRSARYRDVLCFKSGEGFMASPVLLAAVEIGLLGDIARQRWAKNSPASFLQRERKQYHAVDHD